MKWISSILAIMVFPLVVQAQHCKQIVPIQQFQVQQKVVEFDSRYFLGEDGYYSVRDNLLEQKVQEANNENLKLRAEIDVLWKLVQKCLKDNNVGHEPYPEPVPQQPTQPTNPPDDGRAVTELDRKVYNVFSNNCANCHGAEQNVRMKLVDTTKGTLFDRSLDERVEIWTRTDQTELSTFGLKGMPPGKVLNDNDVTSIKQWMIEEALRIRKVEK